MHNNDKHFLISGKPKWMLATLISIIGLASFPIITYACTPSVPPTEVCNGIDDNCDGQIDEGGVCNATTTSCTCKKTTCGAQGATCGTIPDGCGGTILCKACGVGTVCSPLHKCIAPCETGMVLTCDQVSCRCQG